MLRRPGSPYTAGRTKDLQKVKAFHDIEVKVTGHLPGLSMFVACYSASS
jgi:ATP-dependent DNA ligase